MEKRPTALLLKFPGTNCDAETAWALNEAGFETEVCPIAAADPSRLQDYRLIVFPGGFSYGDYVMAGRLAQLELEQRFGSAIQDYYALGGHLLGICNGFQILIRLGILPEGTLIENRSGRFLCRWTGLQRPVTVENAFLRGLPDRFELPVAHAEGRFVVRDESELESLVEDGLVALRYTEEVNGSVGGVAGLQDPEGRVLGLMPHPERFVRPAQHYDPDWAAPGGAWGRRMFSSIYQTLTE